MKNCTSDSDCNATGYVCYGSVTWKDDLAAPPLGQPQFCACSSWYGWGGEDCTSFSAMSWIQAVGDGSVLLVATALGAVLWFDVLQMLLKRQMGWNSTSMTLVATVLGVNALFAWRLLTLATLLSPRKYDYTEYGSEKINVLSVIMRPFVLLTEVLAVVASLNVSVMWIEMAYRAEHMKARAITGVRHYRYAVYSTEAIFFVVMGACAALGEWALSALLALPFLLAISLTFIIGRRKMMAVLDDALRTAKSTASDAESNTAKATASSSKEKSVVERTRRAMLAVQRVSLHVVIALSLLIAVTLIYTALTFINAAAGWKEFVRPNTISLLMLCQTLIPLCLLYAFGAIALYTHRSARKLYRRAGSSHNEQSEPGTNSKSDNVQMTNYTPGNLSSFHHPGAHDAKVAIKDDDDEE
jgi:hypothetical protein